MTNQGRPVLGDIVDLSELRDAIERRRAAQEIGRTDEAELANKAAVAQDPGGAAQSEAQAKDAAAEADRRRALHSYIRERGVTGLGHFTRLKNLESILQRGLLPRRTLDQMGAEYFPNDQLRLDHVEGVCVSISFPNYKLFYRFRKAFPGEHWVVIDLSTAIVEKKACLFNSRNAASAAMTRIGQEARMQMGALAEVFYDEDIQGCSAIASPAPVTLREKLGLQSKFTTDPQAEVVVLEPIEPELFDGVIFNCDDTLRNRRTLDEYSERFGPRWKGRFLPGPQVFQYRHDYEHWQTDNG